MEKVQTVKEMEYKEYYCNRCFKIFFTGFFSKPANSCPYCKNDDIVLNGTKDYTGIGKSFWINNSWNSLYDKEIKATYPKEKVDITNIQINFKCRENDYFFGIFRNGVGINIYKNDAKEVFKLLKQALEGVNLK